MKTHSKIKLFEFFKQVKQIVVIVIVVIVIVVVVVIVAILVLARRRRRRHPCLRQETATAPGGSLGVGVQVDI